MVNLDSNNSENFLRLNAVSPLMPDSPFKKAIDWKINKKEIWSVIGDNGSGKSLLAEIITGRYGLKKGIIDYCFLNEIVEHNDGLKRRILPHDAIKIVHFNGIYSLDGFCDIYYQQRFNSTESENIPFVCELFTSEKELEIIELLNIYKLLNRRLNQLSSGELRKLLIAKALIDNPQMLIFDNPFIGLDVLSREQLNNIFGKLHIAGIQLLFLVPSKKDLPSATSHVLEMNKCEIIWSGDIISFLSRREQSFYYSFQKIDWTRFPESMPSNYKEVVRMENIDIAYGNQIINRGINWTIMRGEKWALSGANGSGKSTLLSYIFADNPQAYAKKISLFDRRRGSGESIWDIKKRIGFTSSEMHLYYRRNVSCLSVIASGFFDSIGLYRKCSEDQLKLAEYMFDLFSISQLKERSFLKISSGEQRLILFARALIKNPDLLILDEPFHGLDEERKLFCTNLIQSFCKQSDKSLIYVTHRKEEIPSCIDNQFDLSGG